MAREKTPSEKYFEGIKTDVLPKSPVIQYFQNRVGLYNVNELPLKREQKDSRHFYGLEEKFVPKRVNARIPSMPGVYSPLFLRHFQNGDITTALERIVANNALRLYPTPMGSHGIVDESMYNAIGVATIDLNHLYNPNTRKHVESARLDHLLHSLGCHYEISCFLDFQSLLENPAVTKNFTTRALVQLGLSSIFIPNAIGETDANSRNVIVLKNQDNKWDSIVRIDAEANTTLNDLNNTRSGHKVVPKGIFSPDEPQEEFLKTIKDRPAGIDWDLYRAFVLAAKEATRRTNIDQGLTQAWLENSGRVDTLQFVYPNVQLEKYNYLASDVFPNSVANRAERHFDRVLDALGRESSIILPFAETSSKYPGLIVDETEVLDSLIQEYYDAKGNNITEEVLGDVPSSPETASTEQTSSAMVKTLKMPTPGPQDVSQ